MRLAALAVGREARRGQVLDAVRCPRTKFFSQTPKERTTPKTLNLEVLRKWKVLCIIRQNFKGPLAGRQDDVESL